MSGFFDSEQLAGPDCHLVYFKGVVIFLESKLPLCLDDFIVHSPIQLGDYHQSISAGPQTRGNP